MKLKLTCITVLVLALSLCAAAQTLVLDPALKGISLSGTADNPMLVNNSGKTIIGTLAIANRCCGSKRIVARISWFAKPLASGASEFLYGHSANRGLMDFVLDSKGQPIKNADGTFQVKEPGVVTSTQLGVVVFEDGEIRGSDDQEMQPWMERRIQTRIKVATLAAAGQWSALQALQATSKDSFEQTAADEVLAAHAADSTNGSKSADEVVSKFNATPGKLWRKP